MSSTVEEVEVDGTGYVSFDGKVPLQIHVGEHYDRGLSPVLNSDKSFGKIGEMRLVKRDSLDIFSLPPILYACFLLEFRSEISALPSANWLFEWDYLIVDKSDLANYFSDYKKTSAVWGGFIHFEDFSVRSYNEKLPIVSVEALESIAVSKQVYSDTLNSALVEPNPFNRFLKLYHVLELQFDIHTAQQISALLNTSGNEAQIGKLLRSYSREDIERLFSLLESNVNASNLVSEIDQVGHYLPIAIDIFYAFGKNSNPFKKESEFHSVINKGGFSMTNVQTRISNYGNYDRFICRLAAYWIYRIRSSVAHNKLGEYLMTSSDEGFIVKFAEPLIRKVIIECFTV